MADPTKIVPYAQQRRAKLSSALDAAKLQLSQALTGINTERGKLAAATTAYAALEETIAKIRAKLAAVPTPGDGDVLLAQLEKAIIDARAKRAEITAAQSAVATAQANEMSALADVSKFTAQLAAIDDFLKKAEPASADRDKLIAALDGQLASISADAAKAVDETKPSGAIFKKAKKRIEDDLPAPLLDRALKRRAAAAADIAYTTTARQAAEGAVRKESDKNGGLGAGAASAWVDLTRAEAAAREFVNSARSRFDQANAALARVADKTVSPLTPEQIARLNAPDPLKKSREDAATEETNVAALDQALDDRQTDLDKAIVDAKANPADAAKQAAVATEQGKVDTAKQNLDAAAATYKGGNAPIMSAWEAAAPDSAWRLLHDYAEAVDTLKNMPDPAKLSKDLKDAEKNYVAAQLQADGTSNVLVDLTTLAAQRAAREDSTRQNSAATLFGALSGDIQ
jgi:chromosome segregation ATPase